MPKLAKRKHSVKCIFCGASSVTWEHVFSRWTHKYLPPRPKGKARGLRGYKFAERDDIYVVKMRGAIRDWQVKCVCGGDDKSCNNGWMRKRVEDAARPLLIPLILGQNIRLSASHQRKIASWIALKAMVSEYDDGDHVTTHHMQRRRMMLRQEPPVHGWGIWIANYERGEWVPEWISAALSLIANPKPGLDLNKPPTHYNGHTSTQVIGKLFIQVIRLPMPGFIERWQWAMPDKGVLLRIWPPTGYGIMWPNKALSDREADLTSSAIDRYFRKLARDRLARARAGILPPEIE